MQHIKTKDQKSFQQAVSKARKEGMIAIMPRMSHGVRNVAIKSDNPYAAWEEQYINRTPISPMLDSTISSDASLDASGSATGGAGGSSAGSSTGGSSTGGAATVPSASATVPSAFPEGCRPRPRSGMRSSSLMSNDATMLDFSQSLVFPTPDGVGTKGMGYIPWGRFNEIPSEIFKLASSQPTTSTGLQYIADTATGLGIRLMYHLARYSGGTVTEEYIPYEKAGVYLRERERELLRKLMELEPSVDAQDAPSVNALGTASANVPSASATVPSASPEGSTFPSASPEGSTTLDKLRTSYQREYDALQTTIADWERTMQWWTAFRDSNNLDLHYQACMQDDAYLGLSFPTVIMEQGKYGNWSGRIVGVSRLDPLITRFEQMTQTATDTEWLSRYVYQCEAWRGDYASPTSYQITSIPVTMPCHGLRHMREYVNANQRTRVRSRQLEWCCPQVEPTLGKPYYPQPAWWSIFPSQVFQYASTLIYDKAVNRKNSQMWGKILFVNISYLKQLFDQAGADTEEAQNEIRDGIYNDVENFLSDRNKNGQLLIMDSYMSADEKNLIDSVRIVDVPNGKNEQHKDDELEQIFSTIFFALGVHPALIGAEPGKKGNSGTFQRELHLLKVTQMAPRQRRMLYFYNSILTFNNLDPNAIFCVKQATLTTLDNSKTGTTETVSE